MIQIAQHSSGAGRTPARSAGFTLVELLAVLAIIALLMSISVMVFGGGQNKARIAKTTSTLSEIETLITAYEEKKGDYPTDLLRDLKITVQNDHNSGIEACLAALHGKDHPTGRMLSEKSMGNTDEDQSASEFHRNNSHELVEAIDAWGNPVAYFHNRNYGDVQTYLLSDPNERAMPDQIVEAGVSAVTGVYANAQSFQLISAGPDEEFGTEDDVTNFD